MVCVGFFLFTFTKLYARHYVWTSLVLNSPGISALTLAAQFQVLMPLSGRERTTSIILAASPQTLAYLKWGAFPCASGVLLYTVMPLTFVLELDFWESGLFCSLRPLATTSKVKPAFPHLDRRPCTGSCQPGPAPPCIHAIGIHLFIMSQVRSRSTFPAWASLLCTERIWK